MKIKVSYDVEAAPVRAHLPPDSADSRARNELASLEHRIEVTRRSREEAERVEADLRERARVLHFIIGEPE